MKELSLVTGANGHLGNNLVRILIQNGIKLRATVRNLNNRDPFDGLDCELAYADIMDKGSLIKAFDGVSSVYAVGASFKLWDKKPKENIYDVNVEGTRNVFEAAHECGVKNIVYVSSVAALNTNLIPMKPENGYNSNRFNWYYNSKNDSDKIALKLGKKYNIRTVLVLPSAMVGSQAFKLSTSNQFVWNILNGKVPVDTNFTLNWIDVKDVAAGVYQAMQKGRDQERYILANEKCMSIQDSIKVAAELFPELKLKTPQTVPKWILYSLAGMMEAGSKITCKEPLLQRHYIDMFYDLKQDYDISKSKADLGFSPKLGKQALVDALKYLKEDYKMIES